MQIDFSHHAILYFHDVVTAILPFVRHGGITIVANSDDVFVTALTPSVDLKFRIPGATAMSTGSATVCNFDLRDTLKERVMRSARNAPLTLVLAGKTCVNLSLAGHTWHLNRQDV